MCRCFAIDRSGFILAHRDFLANPPSTQVHITTKEPKIAADMVKRNIMTLDSCVNYADITNQRFYVVAADITWLCVCDLQTSLTLTLTLRVRPGTCGPGPIRFLVGWRKRPLYQALVLFGLVCAYVGSFLAWLFRFCVSVLTFGCFASVKRLTGNIAYKICTAWQSTQLNLTFTLTLL